MQTSLVERLKAQIEYEFDRAGLPEGFPTLPDLPAGRYTEQGFFDLEQQRMWPRVWLYAGRQEEIPHRGSYAVWDYSGPSIVLVRDDRGLLRAFLNESPNRAPLVPFTDESPFIHESPFDAPGTLFKQAVFPRRALPEGVLRCQRKGWVYDLNGRLVAVPSGETIEQIPHPARQLTEFRCEVWAGFIFVNRDPKATPLIEWLGPVADQMVMFKCESLRLFSRATVLLRTNWKVATESFQEVYHFKHIHQHDGVAGLDQRGATMGLLPNGHSRMLTPYTRRQQLVMGMEGPTDWREDGPVNAALAASGEPLIPGVHPLVNGAVLSYSLFPNLTTPLSSRGFPFLAAWPVDPGHTFFEWTRFIPDWGEESAEIEAKRKAFLDTPLTVMEEDTRNMEPMFLSLSSPGLRGLHIGYQERRLYYCAEVLDQAIGPDRVPERLRIKPLLQQYVEYD
jgi:phenylpropionate dioxygenase-like ring-hydroxylating dioxygenase large terminal subunit